MDLLKVLEEARKERYKAKAIEESLENDVNKLIEIKIKDHLKGFKLTKNNLEYKLYAVKSIFDYWGNPVAVDRVRVSLFFICNSNTTKLGKARIKEAKDFYQLSKQFPYKKYKIPLFYTFHDIVSVESVFRGYINLNNLQKA